MWAITYIIIQCLPVFVPSFGQLSQSLRQIVHLSLLLLSFLLSDCKRAFQRIVGWVEIVQLLLQVVQLGQQIVHIVIEFALCENALFAGENEELVLGLLFYQNKTNT